MARIHEKAGWFAVLAAAAVASGCGSGSRSEDDMKILDGRAHRARSGNEGSAPVVVLGERSQTSLVQSCTDCHTGFPQYDYYASGHGRTGIALGCDACHYNGNEHSGTYKELRPVNGSQYPAVGPDPYATVHQRQGYCDSACHMPIGGHPFGYFFSWDLADWTYAEMLTSQGYIDKYGYEKPMAVPPAVLPLLDVDGNGVNSYGDIMMCETCHDPHGTPEPAMSRVTLTNSAICLACHLL